jgi:hypothetical protein
VKERNRRYRALHRKTPSKLTTEQVIYARLVARGIPCMEALEIVAVQVKYKNNLYPKLKRWQRNRELNELISI